VANALLLRPLPYKDPARLVRISTGEAVFGKFATKKRNRVTYVNIDAGKNSFERRVCRLPKANANFYVVNADLWNLDEFECLLADNYGSFVVLDCWTDIFEQPTDADMAHFMRQSIKYFRDRFEESGANGIVHGCWMVAKSRS